MTVIPTMSQQLQKKLPEKSSGPRELDLLRLNTKALTSLLEGGVWSKGFWAKDTWSLLTWKSIGSIWAWEGWKMLEKNSTAASLIWEWSLRDCFWTQLYLFCFWSLWFLLQGERSLYFYLHLVATFLWISISNGFFPPETGFIGSFLFCWGLS